MKHITACLTTVRGTSEKLVMAILGIVNQTRPPERVIIRDASPEGEGVSDSVLGAWLAHAMGIEVHRAEPMEPLPISRERMVNSAEPSWTSGQSLIWFLDDDIFAPYDCLESLLNCMKLHGVALVAPHVVDVVPQSGGFGTQDWLKQGTVRRRDADVSWVENACLLVVRDAWLSAPGVIPDQKQPDTDMSKNAFVAATGGCMIAGGVSVLHLRETETYWKDEDKPVAWLVSLMSRVFDFDDAALGRFLERTVQGYKS